MQASLCHLAALEPGQPLLDGLRAACESAGVEAGRVLVRGRLQNVEMRPDEQAPTLAVPGPVFLLNGEAWLTGGRLRLTGILSWQGPGTPGMCAGLIDDAISGGVEVVIEPWQLSAAEGASSRPASPQAKPAAPDRSARGRGRKPARGEEPTPAQEPPARRPGRTKPEDPRVDLSAEMADLHPRATPEAAKRSTPDVAKPEAPAASGGGWAAAVAASQGGNPRGRAPARGGAGRGPTRPAGRSIDQPTEEIDGEDLKPGDILVHPTFGHCRVLKPSDGERVTIRKPQGRQVELHLRVLRIYPMSEEDGRRVYKVVIGKARR